MEPANYRLISKGVLEQLNFLKEDETELLKVKTVWTKARISLAKQ